MNIKDLKNLAVGKKLYDVKIPGLYAKKNVNSISLNLIFRNRAKVQKVVKLGTLGVLTIDGAREAAQKILQQVAAGEDPAANWKKQREELTVLELMVKALKEYWHTERFINSGQFRNVLYSVQHYYTKIGKYKLSELTPNIVDRWHKSYAATPCNANHMLIYLITAINWAKKNGLTNIENPCETVKKFPKNRRSRYASAEEIKAIGNYLEEEFRVNPQQAMYLYLILTTGTRPIAIQRWQWKDLIITHNSKDEEVGIISFFGKSSYRTGEKETVVIPPKTLAMMKRLPINSDYILPIKMPQKLWAKIKSKLKLKDLWARDLRRTYATVGLSGGVSLSQVGELLNHRCWDTTKLYAKLMPDERIDSAMKIAKSLDAIIHHHS